MAIWSVRVMWVTIWYLTMNYSQDAPVRLFPYMKNLPVFVMSADQRMRNLQGCSRQFGIK